MRRTRSSLYRGAVVAILAAGMTMIAFAGSTFTYYSLRNAYHTGRWSDWGWSFGWLLIGYASLTRLWWAREPAGEGQEGEGREATAAAFSLFRTVSPYVGVITALALVVWHDYAEPPYGNIMPSTCLAGSILIFLVIARQVFTLVENQQLAARLRAFNENLEQIVCTRTKQLAALHQLTKAINGTRQAGELLTASVEHTRRALGADAVALWLAQEEQVEVGTPLQISTVEGLGATPAVREFIDRQAQLDSARLLCLPRPAAGTASGGGAEGVPANGVVGPGPGERRGGDAAVSETAVLLLAPIRCQDRLLGLVGAVRWQGGFDGSEVELLESVGIEVGTALEMARQYDAAVEAADLDPVTALYNHRFIHQRLDLEMKQAGAREESLSVVMIDVNNFKLFNDTYGHPKGDQVLKRVAHVLREECRKHDLPGRYGGDEFILVLPDSGLEDAMAVAQRLHERMAQEGFQRAGDERTVPVTLSFGIATFPADSRNRHELLTLADANLYAAKQSGKGIQGTTEMQRANRQLRSESSYTVLDGMVTAVDNKDRYTRRHSEDVTEYALWIAEELGLSEETMRVIRMGGLLHDVRKIGVPDEVLRKPGRLTAEEWEVMRRHPHLGALIVGGVPGMEPIVEAVRFHHERWDGQGYPDGLTGEEIPLLGRILAVADAFSAMTTDRPYRKGMEWETALAEIRAYSGTQFDPHLAQAFIAAARKRQPRQEAFPQERTPVRAANGRQTGPLALTAERAD